MTFLVERLAELRKYLAHAERLRIRGITSQQLEQQLSVRNDVVFTLLTLAQLVIDIAAELNARRGERFETYREAIRKLAVDPAFPGPLLDRLERVAGFRNIIVHEYASIDYGKVLQALEELEPIADFGRIIQKIESA